MWRAIGRKSLFAVYFGGNAMRLRLCVAFLLGLILLGLVGIAQAEDNKQLMLVFTTDSNAELNPCG
jgi:hypothetical protein